MPCPLHELSDMPYITSCTIKLCNAMLAGFWAGQQSQQLALSFASRLARQESPLLPGAPAPSPASDVNPSEAAMHRLSNANAKGMTSPDVPSG